MIDVDVFEYPLTEQLYLRISSCRDNHTVSLRDKALSGAIELVCGDSCTQALDKMEQRIGETLNVSTEIRELISWSKLGHKTGYEVKSVYAD